jgi:hypothetical protein
MAKLQGRLEVSRSVVRTSDTRIVGLQALLAIMEVRATSTLLALLLNSFLHLRGAEAYVSFCL